MTENSTMDLVFRFFVFGGIHLQLHTSSLESFYYNYIQKGGQHHMKMMLTHFLNAYRYDRAGVFFSGVNQFSQCIQCIELFCDDHKLCEDLVHELFDGNMIKILSDY